MTASYKTFLKKADNILLPIATSDKKKKLSKIAASFDIDSSFLNQSFAATKGETLKLFAPSISKSIYLIACGDTLDSKSILDTFKRFSYKENKHFQGKVGVDFSYLKTDFDTVEAAINGFALGYYSIGLYKTDTSSTPIDLRKWSKNLLIQADFSKKDVAMCLNKAIATAESQMSIMDLVNAPGNKATPQALAHWATQSGKKYAYNVQVLHNKQIEKEGLHTVLAVNRGSEFPAEFIVLEYRPKNKKKYPTIGLVGKGVTFDTGGISIKGHQNMHYMKSDMGGAAAVLGAVELAAKLQLPIHLVAAIPATDNCVDATAVKPGDVIDSYAGKTIEIIDTDAEGRLILADGLAYINKNYKPDVLLDLATLTGSCVRTLGYHAGGLFTNNDQLAQQLETAGQKTGERLWRLPIWGDYFSEIKSDVADIKNFSGRPLAGAIVAAKFLEFFTNNHPRWAHLDIAGVAFGDSGLSREKSATAYGVRLLTAYFEALT